MSKIIIEYEPEISEFARERIRENVSPSMVAPGEETSQYDISMCEQELAEYGDVFEDEVAIIQKLMSEKVAYLEF